VIEPESACMIRKSVYHHVPRELTLGLNCDYFACKRNVVLECGKDLELHGLYFGGRGRANVYFRACWTTVTGCT
jgi:hypothetical protein